ncbi:MAG TPA: 4-hydroxy-3-methylbut-2-enyl diphosphate reductase [Candidatus Paceibacterota bacterium]|nr:4-hydroxy-3-methylbut-2-enyl diphosphate reductase [Verrucomicrobiota bacterium]HRY48350.1 4-hydroxy-3-methylbut-2-enyl diphosphate reductase [Candidatus Paceibacterota bacterium]HSA01311.1 4-hydroxy-3-methylbut-2-enyl diphosphate reductase [Candidatus Paceibacterota bacterium]
MKIIRATAMGFCFGVREAVNLALTEGGRKPLSVLGELVHNPDVLKMLHERRIRLVSRVDEVRTATVMITAHGASDRTKALARAAGLEVLEATCPLVQLVHRTVRQLVDEGYHPVIVGQKNHTEVRGITEDLDAFDMVLEESDVDELVPRPRFGVVAQTTQPIARVRNLVQRIRNRFPASEVRLVDTVCQPTKQRQAAVVELARKVDMVLVIGGRQSNNTRQLVEACRLHCGLVYHVESARDVASEWFAHISSVGITAGTSTPDFVIDAVERRVQEIAVSLETGAADEKYFLTPSLTSTLLCELEEQKH